MKTQQALFAYAVHGFTASGLIFTFLSLLAILDGKFIEAFILNGIAIFIDAFDGMLARKANVKKYGDRIDGALMDNIIDFITYTLMPAFVFMFTPLIPENLKYMTISALLLSSIFQFSNTKAKTEDHFFLGFPSYWNIVVLYLWMWNLPGSVNTAVVWILSILSFIPVKFVYPSRLDYFAKNVILTKTFYAATLAWGVVTLAMLLLYPNVPVWMHIAVIGYMCWYTWLSLVRTFSNVSK